MSERKSSSNPVIRVGVADKSPLVQAALTHLFAEDHRFELVDVWADGASFLKSIERCDLNVVVTGWVISPGNGKFILDQLRAHANAPRIVVYTGAEGESVPSQVMAHGGAAFVSKREGPHGLSVSRCAKNPPDPFDVADETGAGSTFGTGRRADEQADRCCARRIAQHR